MAFEVKMPQLGLTMEEGTVTKWVKQEGDTVKAGDVILEITTDKLTSEVESEHDGVLLKIVAQEGEDIPVKGLLAYIGEAGEQVGMHLRQRQKRLRQKRRHPCPQQHLQHLLHLWQAAESEFPLWQRKQRQSWG